MLRQFFSYMPVHIEIGSVHIASGRGHSQGALDCHSPMVHNHAFLTGATVHIVIQWRANVNTACVLIRELGLDKVE